MPKIKTSSGYIHYKVHPLYPGIKQINKDVAIHNLSVFKDVMDANDVTYILTAGTLLGAIREKDFISHDEDIDIAFLHEDKQKVIDIIPQLMEKGFKVARYDIRGLISIIRNNEYIDLYFFKKINNEIRSCCGWLVLDEFFQNLDKIVFKGLSFTVPKNYIGFLRCEYGENWQTPIKWNCYNIPKWERLLFCSKEIIKEVLPSFLFLKIAKKSEQKMYDKYIRKINIYKKQI